MLGYHGVWTTIHLRAIRVNLRGISYKKMWFLFYYMIIVIISFPHLPHPNPIPHPPLVRGFRLICRENFCFDLWTSVCAFLNEFVSSSISHLLSRILNLITHVSLFCMTWVCLFSHLGLWHEPWALLIIASTKAVLLIMWVNKIKVSTAETAEMKIKRNIQ